VRVLAAIGNGWDVYRGDQTDIIITIATYLRLKLLTAIRNFIRHLVCLSDMSRGLNAMSFEEC
jgi:hypothetical protein